VPLNARPIPGELLGFPAAQRDDPTTVDPTRGQEMDHPHETDADDADPHHCCKSFALRLLETSTLPMSVMGGRRVPQFPGMAPASAGRPAPPPHIRARAPPWSRKWFAPAPGDLLLHRPRAQ